MDCWHSGATHSIGDAHTLLQRAVIAVNVLSLFTSEISVAAFVTTSKQSGIASNLNSALKTHGAMMKISFKLAQTIVLNSIPFNLIANEVIFISAPCGPRWNGTPVKGWGERRLERRASVKCNGDLKINMQNAYNPTWYRKGRPIANFLRSGAWVRVVSFDDVMRAGCTAII